MEHPAQDSRVFIPPTLHCLLPIFNIFFSNTPLKKVVSPLVLHLLHVDSHGTDTSLHNLPPIVQRQLNKLDLIPRSLLSLRVPTLYCPLPSDHTFISPYQLNWLVNLISLLLVKPLVSLLLVRYMKKFIH